MTLVLIDDGTLSTVFMCETCKIELRYPWCLRERDGSLSSETLKGLEREHATACVAPYEKLQELEAARMMYDLDVFDSDRAVRETTDDPNAR